MQNENFIEIVSIVSEFCDCERTTLSVRTIEEIYIYIVISREVDNLHLRPRAIFGPGTRDVSNIYITEIIIAAAVNHVSRARKPERPFETRNAIACRTNFRNGFSRVRISRPRDSRGRVLVAINVVPKYFGKRRPHDRTIKICTEIFPKERSRLFVKTTTFRKRRVV